MHPVSMCCKFPGIIALVVTVLFASTSTPAQEEKVEYIPTKLSDTLTMLKGRGGNIAISAGEDGVYIIDDQLEPVTDQLLVAISQISSQPIRFVINTHYHGDHVGGNEAIGKAGAVIIAHDNIHKRMSSDQFNHFFDADGDSIVHFPASDVIHMGDIYFNGLYPYIDLDGGGSIQGMISGAELGLSIAGKDTQIIPGHGPMGDKASLAEYRDFLVKARNNVQKLIDEGNSLEQAVAAQPTAQWDAILGEVWITPEQLVTFIYNSLKGIAEFTPLNSEGE